MLTSIKTAKVFDARFYKELFADNRVHDVYRQHNGAAKWFRRFCEQNNSKNLDFPVDTAVAVKKVLHDKKGTGFRFDMESPDVH